MAADDMPEAPRGLSIGQVAERTGLSVHTLRFYERSGILANPVAREATGRRVYSDQDVEWLDICTKLRSSGMPLAAIRRYADLVRLGPGNEEDRLGLLRQHSLAEFTLGGGTSSDFYDVSFVDAFNIPIMVSPVGGITSSGNAYQCTTAGCTANLNPGCPAALQDVDSSGNIIACLSACSEFGTAQYCCTGAYGSPSTCIPSQWPADYAAYFKSACPGAYSYAYDDPTSTFTCQGASGYVITFGQFSAATSGGGGGSGTRTNATSTIQAADYTAQNDTQTQATSDTGGGLNVGWIQNGSWLQYDNIDFGSTGLTRFTARVASGAAAGISGLVEVVLDDLSNAPVATFSIANTGGWQDWVTVPANMTATTGTHTVYLVFVSGQSADFVNIHWFTFS